MDICASPVSKVALLGSGQAQLRLLLLALAALLLRQRETEGQGSSGGRPSGSHGSHGWLGQRAAGTARSSNGSGGLPGGSVQQRLQAHPAVARRGSGSPWTSRLGTPSASPPRYCHSCSLLPQQRSKHWPCTCLGLSALGFFSFLGLPPSAAAAGAPSATLSAAICSSGAAMLVLLAMCCWECARLPESDL